MKCVELMAKTLDGETFSLGLFEDFEEAHAAQCNILFGELHEYNAVWCRPASAADDDIVIMKSPMREAA